MIAVTHISLAEFRPAGTLPDLPRHRTGETKGKQNGTKTTFFPSVTRANFPLEKNARASSQKNLMGFGHCSFTSFVILFDAAPS
jgi:hypothetical protein